MVGVNGDVWDFISVQYQFLDLQSSTSALVEAMVGCRRPLMVLHSFLDLSLFLKIF